MATQIEKSHPTRKGIKIIKDVKVPMRDGVRISADIYLPEDAQKDEKFPVLYATSCYGKEFDHYPLNAVFRFRECGPIQFYVERGYAYVRTDSRGTGQSLEGVWTFFDKNEQTDLYDTIEWIASQEWCTGKIGMIGESYFACAQLWAAVQNPPHLACIAPFGSSNDMYRDLAYHGGIFSEGFCTWWANDTRLRHLMDVQFERDVPPNIASFDLVAAMARHPFLDDFWKERSAFFQLDKIKVPVYVLNHWNYLGIHLRGTLKAFEKIQSVKKLMVHAVDPTVPFSTDQTQKLFDSEPYQEHLLRWYDHWLKGYNTGILDEEPQVKIQVRGDPNASKDKFLVLDNWPPKNVTPTCFYLNNVHSKIVESSNDGGLSTEHPTESNQFTTYEYPGPNWGGYPGPGVAVIGEKGIPNPIKQVLTFTTAPLKSNVRVIGPIKAVLYASCDQKDVDFFVKISDMHSTYFIQRTIMHHMDMATPADRVTVGWLKASHRKVDPEKSTPLEPWHPHEEAEPLEPGKIYQFEIEIWPTAYLFHKDNRIRVEISTGDSQIFDAPFWHRYYTKWGKLTIYHDKDHPSHIVMPVCQE